MGLCTSKSDQIDQVPQTETIRTQANVQKQQSTGIKLGTNIDTNNKPSITEASPQQAAKMAAERRLQLANDSLNKGKLGQKLAKERGKSYRN